MQTAGILFVGIGLVYFLSFGLIIKIVLPNMRSNKMDIVQYIDKNRTAFFIVAGFYFGFICMAAVLLILVGISLIFFR